jgi:hypothetical protein
VGRGGWTAATAVFLLVGAQALKVR